MAWTLRFSDAFTNAAFTDLQDHNATWTCHQHAGGQHMRIATGGATVGGTGNPRASISTTLANKQAVQVLFKTDGGVGVGPMCRFANAGDGFWDWTGYFAYYLGGTITIYRGDNDGSGHSLGTRTVTLVDGDVLRIEADLSSITVLVNGVQQGAAMTDSGYASGRAAIMIGSTVDQWGDDFAAYDDDGTGGAPAVLPFRTTIGAHRWP